MDQFGSGWPAPAVWEAVFLPAEGSGEGKLYAEAETCFGSRHRSEAQRQGSAAGRAVLNAHGIQLPSPEPMRSLAKGVHRPAQTMEQRKTYPVARVLAEAEGL